MDEVSSSVSLRPATVADDSFLLALYASTRSEEFAGVGWNEQQTQAFLQMQFEAQRRCYPEADNRIILLHERAVGRIMVDRSEEAMLLVDISLLPEFRNAGIGTRLLRDLLNEATVAATPVRLHVLASNAARRLYERLGFTPIMDESSSIGGARAYLEMTWVPAVSR